MTTSSDIEVLGIDFRTGRDVLFDGQRYLLGHRQGSQLQSGETYGEPACPNHRAIRMIEAPDYRAVIDSRRRPSDQLESALDSCRRDALNLLRRRLAVSGAIMACELMGLVWKYFNPVKTRYRGDPLCQFYVLREMAELWLELAAEIEKRK